MRPGPFEIARAFYEELDAAGVTLTDQQYGIFKRAVRKKIKECKEREDDAQRA